MSNRPYGVPKWQYGWRRNVILSAFVALAIAVSSGLWLAYPHFTDNPAPKAAASAPADDNPSFGIPPHSPDPEALTADEWNAKNDNETANAILNAHPEHYKCRTYPAANILKKADLVPTANVNIVFTFDKNTKRYTAKADKRVQISTSNVTDTGDSGKTYAAQRFEWQYPAPVAYFATVGFGQDENRAWRWSSHGATVNGNRHVLTLTKIGGTLTPKIVALASDPRGCAAGSVAIPDQKRMMRDLAKNGLLQPEGY